MKRRSLLSAAAMLAAAAAVGNAGAAERRGILIGTGAPGGIYYSLGGAICRFFNLNAVERGMPIRCAAQISAGSVENVEALQRGRIDAALIQSDVLADAVAGKGRFAAQSAPHALKVAFVAHDEPFTVVSRADASIQTATDLVGKRINIGEAGSGHRFRMERVLLAIGAKHEEFARVLELDPIKQVQALCSDRVDAIVYSVGHPNGLVQEALGACNGRLVPVVGERIDAMIRQHAEYTPMIIPGALYPGAADTQTFGTRALLVISDRASAAVVYELTKSVFESIDDLRRLHPAFQPFVPERMARIPAFATAHDGAARYYRERGWSK